MDDENLKNDEAVKEASDPDNNDTSSDKNEVKPKKSKRKKLKKIIIIVLCILLSIVLILVSTFFILVYIGKKQFHQNDTHIVNDAVTIEDDDTITYKDKKYVLNKDIISILVIGIDRENINDNLGNGNNGQADVIFIAALDTKTNRATIIPISRETMVDVNIYSTSGKYVGTEKEQICLAYAYGSSPKESSENVMTSVKRLFYGINISNYVAIEMEGISKLTDMVGGVELTCIESFDYFGQKYYTKGESLSLNGKTAISYIQYRGTDLEANDRRMQRQKQFLSALISKAGNAILSDFTMLGSLYGDLSPYFSSNISIAQLTYLANECLTVNFGDLFNYESIEGELIQGEKWVEFTPDEEALLDLIVDVFYKAK